MARLTTQYTDEVLPALRERFSYGNIMRVPRLVKIVVNAGVGEAVGDPKALEAAVIDLTAITGQKPSVRRAKKAISNFKLRQGMAVGAMVTLRRERMYEFLDRLVNFALPQVRDFRGLPIQAFDGRGNYTMGVREQIIFPEIDYDRIDRIRGMDITFVTTAETDEEARELLRLFGMPFSN
jgi:large subunit ribosomal protein L5